MEKEIVHKDLLYVVAKAMLFARDFVNVHLSSAVFDSGVYRVVVFYDDPVIPVKPFVNDIVDEHVLCKDIVLKILEDVPSTRDDDKLLLQHVWSRQGINIDWDIVDLDLMFSAESITRSRRKIQNDDGLFLPTCVSVAIKRRINEDLLRSFYGKGGF